MRCTVGVINAGVQQYASSLRLQCAVRDRVKNGTLPNTLIVVEHPPVYTVGIRDKSYTKEQEATLVSLGAQFHRTNRGGLITFHGPGQLVAYPVLNLKQFTPSVRWYVCSLEKTIIRLCAHYGLEAYVSPHTGVWVSDSKICAIGIHASRYLTTHGLALNCNTDLSWFNHIVPCGIPDKTVTSLTQQLAQDIKINDVIPVFLKSFEEIFDVECVPLIKERLISDSIDTN